jgi:hypothetical protein
MEWMPWFPAQREDTVVRGSGGAQTNIITDSKRSEPQTNIVTDSDEHEPETEEVRRT